MATTPLQITVSLTLHELNTVLDALKDKRSNSNYYVHKDSVDEFMYQGEIARYNVTGAEDALPVRAALADLIFKLSGEVIAEKPEHMVTIMAARKQYDAQEAAKAAQVDEEV